ncbi:MAG TPA: hypothetical protein VGE02_07510 [Gemmatimonadales bacterium]
MPGRHLPPDHSAGDERTLGGYAAVHSRPAAFEGPDGMSYSVEVLADETGEPERPWGGYLLFMRWRRVGASGVEGHLESDFLRHGASEAEALDAVRRMTLWEAREVLDALVERARGDHPTRRWWDVMRMEDDEHGAGG